MNIRILVVDDREDNRYFLQSLLGAHGYTVEAASDGIEALERAHAAPPALIVSDLLMPRMDGYALLQVWKSDEQLRDIPFIVYTATYTSPQDEQLARRLGADSFLIKPMEPDALLASVREVLARPARTGEPVAGERAGNANSLFAQYSKRLVGKLEQKMSELEAANAALRTEIAERSRLETIQRAILDALHANIALLDETGRIVDVNEAWRRFGRENDLRLTDSGVGENYLAHCERLGRAGKSPGSAIAKGIRAVIAGELPRFTTEYPCHSPTEKRWFGLAVTATGGEGRRGAVVMHYDISERVRAQYLAEDLGKRLERLIDQASVGILVHRRFRPVLANQHLAKSLGYESPDDILRAGSCIHLFAEEEWPRIEQMNSARLRGEDVPSFYLIKARHRNGATMIMENRAFVIDWAGEPAVCAMLLDVTQRVNMEKALQQSERLNSIGQLTGGIAHDFNNLLTVILGNAELLSEELAGNERLSQLAKMSGDAASRGADLTQRLLAFSRRQALAPAIVDVAALTEGMRDLLRRTLTASIEMRFILPQGLWPAFADPAQIESALLNLAINARDAMPEGGRLTVEASNAWLGADYATLHPDVTPGAYVMLGVTDTGTGIAPADIEKVFEPFFTTKAPGKGTGLGLSMVYGFAKQSGGHVKIYSEVGRGTSVKLYLPRATIEGAPAAESVADNQVTRGAETVLVVEDDDLVRSHVEGLLSSLGYRVVIANSGPVALKLLQEGIPVDLLFTDMVMPGGMNGKQLADEAQMQRPGLKVLFTSGYTQDAIVHQGRLDPGVHLLSKPYRRADLAKMIRHVIDKT